MQNSESENIIGRSRAVIHAGEREGDGDSLVEFSHAGGRECIVRSRGAVALVSALRLPAGLDDLLGEGEGHSLVVLELHRELTAAAR